MKLQNKVVWITGASSGIGKALALELIKYDCKIILSARRETELKSVANSLKISSENLLILPLDLEQYEQVEFWVQQVLDKFGQIDVLINNGGVSQEGNALDTQQMVEQKIMDINYFGNVALAKEVAKVMQQKKNGKIAVVTSILGKFGLPSLSTYAASKHALYGFYDSFRMELINDNVKVLLIAPGFINTNVTINAINSDGSKYNKNSPAQENGMKASIFAKKFVKALQSNKNHKYIGKKELLAIPFKLFFPNWFYRLMYKLNKKKA